MCFFLLLRVAFGALDVQGIMFGILAFSILGVKSDFGVQNLRVMSPWCFIVRGLGILGQGSEGVSAPRIYTLGFCCLKFMDRKRGSRCFEVNTFSLLTR